MACNGVWTPPDTNVSAPTAFAGVTKGAMITDSIPSARTSSVCSGVSAAARINSSVMSFIRTGRPVWIAVISASAGWADTCAELPGKFDLRGVLMRQSHLPGLPSGIEQIDAAPVGELWDGAGGHMAKCGFVVQRFRQHGSRLGEERSALLSTFRFRTKFGFALIRFSGAKGASRNVGQSGCEPDLGIGEDVG